MLNGVIMRKKKACNMKTQTQDFIAVCHTRMIKVFHITPKMSFNGFMKEQDKSVTIYQDRNQIFRE